MSLSVTPYSNTTFKSQNSQPTTSQSKPISQRESTNPISRTGETMNLIKATFLGGLALGLKLLWEIFDGDFVFETAEKGARKLVDKSGRLIDENKRQIAQNKKELLYFGATAGLIAAGISGFALLYTILNAPKIAYKSKVNTFQKGKEMDVYIKANKAEQDIYSQMSEKAKSADDDERDKLKEQFMQMKLAKNQVPNFIQVKK